MNNLSDPHSYAQEALDKNYTRIQDLITENLELKMRIDLLGLACLLLMNGGNPEKYTLVKQELDKIDPKLKDHFIYANHQ